MSIKDYQQTQGKVETQRMQDYRQLGTINAHLMEAQKDLKNAKLLTEAVTQNQQFWSRLRLYMTQGANDLPEHVRKQCLALAEWVERESVVVAAGGAQNLSGLIAVNQKLMEGLH